MNRARTALVVALGAAVVALTVGSGALSTATVDREAAVGVAGDGGGYLGFERPAGGVASDPDGAASDPHGTASPAGATANAPGGARPGRAGGHASVLLVVRNRFSVPVTVTAAVRDGAAGPPVVRNATGPGRLGPGGAGPVTATVRCGDAGDSGRVAVVVGATGAGVDVSATRHVTVVCRGPDGGR